ncbi:homoserine O-acetyltransferase/O-succinyltransferase family protein [Liquorilactobacillus oeni]|nr:homoserine O-succinyltransferase [Liquorilactobacillus oeni]
MGRQPMNIGILNIMHDKIDTKKRFDSVLKAAKQSLKITYFYPTMHYRGREVPEYLLKFAEPLALDKVSKMDAFIVTGAPLERLDFNEVTYWKELKELFAFLKKNEMPQLYICWGAMAAANYFYGIDKKMLVEKIFGVYQHKISGTCLLLEGLKSGFKAPHARYADLNKDQILSSDMLKINALSMNGELFLMEARTQPQTFLFAHLEYGKDALTKEYQREAAAYPEKAASLAKPQNYYLNENKMTGELFSWANTQKVFFENWLKRIYCQKRNLDIDKLSF